MRFNGFSQLHHSHNLIKHERIGFASIFFFAVFVTKPFELGYSALKSRAIINEKKNRIHSILLLLLEFYAETLANIGQTECQTNKQTK